MKRLTLALAALVLLLAAPLPVRAAGEDQRPAAPQRQEKEQYEKTMKERLGKLGEDLDELKASAADKTGKVEGQMKGYLSEAEKKQKEATRKLDELGQASKDSWRKFTGDMEKAAKDFEQAFSRAKSRFSK